MRASLLTTALVLISIPIQAQELPASSLRNQNPANSQDQADRIIQLIDKAESHFKLGQLNLNDNNKDAALAEFDKAVDSILESGLDVRAHPRLNNYYIQLVERIHKIGVTPQVGLKEQKFTPSPLDELSKLSSSPDIYSRSGNCAEEMLRNLNVRGFRLGMAIQEVKARLPLLKISAPNRFGYSKGDINPATAKDPEILKAFRGVRFVSFDFLDGRLIYFVIFYDNSVKWNDSDEFIEQVAASLNLSGRWESYQPERRYTVGELKVLKCGTVSLVAGLSSISTNKAPVLYWSDDKAFQIVSDRANAEAEIKARKEEEQRRTFKP